MQIYAKVVNIILKITKTEMEYLTSKGVPMGYNGISHTVARGRRTYYMTESKRNLRLLEKYRESRIVK